MYIIKQQFGWEASKREDWSPHFTGDAVFEGRPVMDEDKRQRELEERPF